MNIIHVVGTRPNFMKAAPVIAALEQHIKNSQITVHTGQHYDANMSGIFFKELGLAQPRVNLKVGSGSHAVQTAEIMTRFEKVVKKYCADLVVVYGDVNSTFASALVAAKLNIKIAHVEAGLRSFDSTMPEELNRLLTDQIADLLFTPSEDGDQNLLREGITPEKIHRVGNAMIDTLVRFLPKASQLSIDALIGKKLRRYGLVTLHRPTNVDMPETLKKIMRTLADISCELPLIFPIHPRTRRRLVELRFSVKNTQLHLVEPLSYLEFLGLQRFALLVITDSGGIQEETTYLQIPCLTVRENTERPITVTMGTNILVGNDMERLKQEVAAILSGSAKQGSIPPLWDGNAGVRIAQVISKLSSQ